MANLLTTLVGFALVLTAPDAGGQQFDRRSREEPEIVVEAGGRFGACDVLRFSGDGRLLFAAGDDKVVRVWPYTSSGLETERAKAQVLRWRAWREQRGGIQALDISSDGKNVVVGGYGMKPSTVAVLDRATGETVALTWPLVRKGDANFNIVTAVAFHADGRVGFGTADGSLWLWNPKPLPEPDQDGRTAAPPVRVGKHDLPKRTVGSEPFNRPRLIWFSENGTLVSVAQSGQVYACAFDDTAADTPERPPPGKELFNVNAAEPVDARVYRVERIDGGRWIAVASADSKVLLCRADGKQTVRLELGKDRFPRSLAWHPKTRALAVGVGRALAPEGEGPRFFAEGNDEVRIYADPLAKPGAEPDVITHTGRAEALAFHPTDARLAIAGGDADEITVRKLDKPDEKPQVVRGGGRRPWAVNLSENGKMVGIQTARDARSLDPNKRGSGPWSRFDLSRLKESSDEGQKWVGPVRSADGWEVVPNSDNRYEWFVERTQMGERQRFRLELDRFRDLAPTCYTFLPASEKRPTRVIVGHYYGCTLFELVPERAVRGGFVGTKVYTGHAGEVTSVVAARSQTWFVTGGTDQTVAAWSLEDWKDAPNLGATFEEHNGAVRVVTLETGSPAWEAGLRKGDVLDLLAVDRVTVFDRTVKLKAVGTPQDALAALKAPKPRIELYFGIAAGEKTPRRETLTTVRQRPTWKWFPAFDSAGRMNDWVVWMWHGSYYHTKTVNGDRLVGWHVNAPDPGGRPEFYQLQQFERLFHRPDVMETLVDAGVAAALLTARNEHPTRDLFNKSEPAPVRLGLGHHEVTNAGLPVTITVRARGTNPDLLPERVELWLNDFLIEEWPRAGRQLDPRKPFEERYPIPANRFRAGPNRLTVVAVNSAGGRVEEVQWVPNPRSSPAARLFAVLVGVNDYSGTRQMNAGARNFGDLLHARNDATELGKLLKQCAGGNLLYETASADTHLDPKRGKLLDALRAVADQVQPDDTLVVFFAGHGDVLMPNDGPVPTVGPGLPGDKGAFVLCTPNYSPAKPTETAVAADELFAALAKVNCRKVVLLDACHSGRLATTNMLRRCVPNGQGPLIIAACDEGQRSYEHAKYQHGLFTRAVLNALDKDRDYRKADFDNNGVVSADELFDYVSAELPALLRGAGLSGPQTPASFPRDLPKDPLIKR
ncbi:Caspase domain protein [Gemmata obscuriglobus]|uniref:Peptidase C14 caspase domain-containing protein n=1 Tax=Gemmata obscuriglobus TaxID=114 RepID=A0A2Z3GTU5_9BACT|nr:caspase family protein [Gemmata obscuriglobus]AWM37193.1 hypothetical protein C1280_09265 [Gemmata obscuriglobus]QEG30068.1 Caspase domain protein [Gemmata obscuriglobus]VTS09389.1 wd40 repeat-containing protein : WD40 repeat-containing protein OS=Singulisphaera acidiphila (strain ATCC BAA-1392 / DSM 18658 / VKM B-2454 / MOB10) GN=Sinac_6302 PE=4 SV=1: WD40: WD40: Peptidase_C14 [Gemmata obscuriglobus UQM 2246]